MTDGGTVTPTRRGSLDPEIAAALDAMPPFVFTAETLPVLRQQGLVAPPELSDRVERTDHVVPGPPGEPDVVVRVHRPVGLEGTAPCLLSIHGGGFVFGSYEGVDLRFDRWCPELGCIGVAVEYRLAPETPYPGPLEDCYAALRWVHDRADDLGVDRERIGICGISAGGGLAAALALLARDRGGPPVAFQLLIYPMLDDRQVTASSAWEVPVWNPQANELGWRSYLGERYGTDDVPAYAAPARATDLRGLPPAFVCVGTHDVFSDEDIEYARRLNAADVPVELHVYAGAPHGFDTLTPRAGVARRCRAEMLAWLRARMATAAAG